MVHDWHFKLTWSLFFILPLLPWSFEEGKAPKQCTLSPSLLSTNLVNKVGSTIYFAFFAFSVFLFLFCFVLFLSWGRGGEGVERRGKGESMSFDLRCFFPKVIFYIIPYVRAFLLIQCFFNWVFFFLPKMFRKPWKKSTCVTRWAFRLNLLPRDIVFLLFS